MRLSPETSFAAEVEAIVTPISSFYTLLSTYPYLPASNILTPPFSGWSAQDIANLRKLGKTDLVVEVLKHLPYIRTEGCKGHLTYEDTLPIAYVMAVGGEYVRVVSRLAKLEDGTVVDHELKWDHEIALHG